MKGIAAILVLLLSYSRLTAAQGTTVAVNTPDEFTTAVWNTSVSTITVLKDLNMSDVLRQRWALLPDHYLLTRNLSIMGLEGSYPVFDMHYWRTDKYLPLNYTGRRDQNTAKGIIIGTNVTLTFKRIIIKRSSFLVPEVVAGGQDPSSSFFYFEDCILHRYALVGDPAYAMTVTLRRSRPAWSGPNPNNDGSVLPEGYCRTAPDPAKCWQYSFMIWDYAEDWSAFGLVPAFRAAMRFTATVAEALNTAECYNQYFNGNNTCFVAAALALQMQEAAQGGFWLGSPPTQQQIDNAAAGLVVAEAEYEQMLVERAQPKANKRKRVVIGIAVGASIGGLALLLSVVAAVLMYRRRSRAASMHEDAEAGISKSCNATSEINIGSTDDSHKLVGSMQPNAEFVLSATKPNPLKCDMHTSPFSTTVSGVTPTSDNDTLSSIQSSLKQQELRTGTNSSQPTTGDNIDGRSANVQSNGSTQADAAVLHTECLEMLLAQQTSGVAIPAEAVLPHGKDLLNSGTEIADTMRLYEVVTPDTMIPTTLVTDVQLGTDVTLGRKIGSGAMGTVYEATFRDTPVAVKLLSPGADLKSFEHELGILGRTRHPNVIRLLAANLTSSSQPLLVEELAHGSLEELLYPPQPNPGPNPTTSHITPGSLPVLPTPLPMSVVLSLALDIASGLAYLHPTILHRDLKPGNVLLLCASHTDTNGSKHDSPPVSRATADDADRDFKEEIGTADTADISQAVHQPGSYDAGEQYHALHAKISDFGLSRMHDAMTVVTQKPHCGTLPYMAPECFSRERPAGLTHKCDIYSFGVLLWEMLHGTRPWDGCTPVQIVYEVVINQARPPIIEDETRCPRQLRKLIMRCWDADPYRRPPALEVARELALIQRQLGCVNVTAAA